MTAWCTLQFGTVDCLCDQSEASISFGRYAAKYRTNHAQSDDGVIQNDVQKLVTKLFSSSGVCFNNWIALFDVERGYGHSLRTSYNIPHRLYYASLLGLLQTVNELVLSSSLADVNMAGGLFGSALASASARGQKEVVQILLENGANVDMVEGYYGSALASASTEGRNEIVQILLENGADVNMEGGEYGSALSSASTFGKKEVVQILLENGANVNMVGGKYGTVLALASAFGRKEIAQILLENGADVNMVEGEYDSALTSASARGREEIVQILLENGADVNIMVGGNMAVRWRRHRLLVKRRSCRSSSRMEPM